MNALFAFAGLEVWHIAGWTMLHFLWLGMLVGAMAIVLRLLLRRAAANVRYAAALCCLILLAALPVGIATWLTISPPFQNPPLAVGESHGEGDLLDEVDRRTHAAAQIAQPIIELKERDPAPTDSSAPGRRSAVAGSAGGFADEQHSRGEPFEYVAPLNLRQSRGLFAFRNTLESCAPYLPWLWIIGTPITFALLATGIIGTKRLRNTSRAIDDPRIAELMSRLTASLRIGRRVSIAICERIASPVLIGIVRPIILLPPAALSGWSPDEIEMVLLHELAHVRRWDNLVNLMQRLVESLLFFHPAVWLISTWVRRERESCCDAFVVRRTERPHAYAELLLNLACVHPPLAGLAFARHPLRTRIRRILQLEDDPMLISGKSLALSFAALLVAATLAVLYLPTIGQAEESTTEVTEDTEPSEVPGGDTVEQSESKADKNLNLSGPAATAIPIETDLLLREIAELQKRKGELEGRLYELQTNFTVLKGRLGERKTPDDQYKPNLELQQLTKEFQIEFGALRTQLAEVAKSLEEKMMVLKSKVETSADLETTATQYSKRKFPSLEDQKLADLVWKRLGLEMESIGEKELERVKALGYDGGLRVSGKPGVVAKSGADQVGESIVTGDILVGLHVWPTTSMKALVEVLNREDLAELNPLKFYVIRQGVIQSPNEQKKLGDIVATGRVSVNQAPQQSSPYAPSGRYSSQPVLNTPPPASAPATANNPYQTPPNSTPVPNDLTSGLKFIFFHSPNSQPSKEMKPIAEREAREFRDAQYRVIDASQNPQLASRFDVDAIPTCLIVREGKIVHRLVGLQPADKLREAIQSTMALQTDLAATRSQNDLPQYVLPSPETEAADAPKPRSKRRVAAPGAVPPPKSFLRYDGKSFDEWRDTWRTELSIDKRLEAVKALATFGARGYGREAAEAILEVAAEYEARASNNDTPEGRLMQAVVDGLATKVPASEWRPLLRKRFDADPKQWQWLAIATLREIKPTDENEKKETQDFLLELARNDVGGISWDAVSALVKLDPALENAETKQLVMERLNSDQLNAVRQILSDLSRTPQHPPELIDLLLHGDPQKQKLIRQALDRSPPWKANLALVDSLTAVLKDETKAADHLATIRALAAFGQAAQRAESKPLDVLQAIVKNENAELQVAAAFAIGQITRGQFGEWPQLTGKLRDADGNDLDTAAIQKRTQNEREAVFGKNAK